MDEYIILSSSCDLIVSISVHVYDFITEYDDGYEDDDYGTGSYSDNYCVSPGTAAEFTFNRDRRADTSFADYLSREEEREIPEESEEEAIADELDDSSHYVKPQLTDEQEGK